jgi:hypothetical protein
MSLQSSLVIEPATDGAVLITRRWRIVLVMPHVKRSPATADSSTKMSLHTPFRRGDTNIRNAPVGHFVAEVATSDHLVDARASHLQVASIDGTRGIASQVSSSHLAPRSKS